MIVRLAAEGAVVQDADDCGSLHLETDLDAAALQTALKSTATGELLDEDTALLDLAVLRSTARLVATSEDWPQRWAAMVADAGHSGRLSEDGLSVAVPVER